MKILIVNKFLYPKGGDAISSTTTGKILEANGHKVVFWGMAHPDNPYYPYEDEFVSYTDFDHSGGIFSKIMTSINIIYSIEARKKLRLLLEKFQPDIVHLNNFAHQISPSILDEIKADHIPVVMTMHDYKMVCPVYSMLCQGKVCEKCQGGQFYQCAINQCTKGSLFKSLINVVEMYMHHKILHIYDKIDLYISPSRFLKNKTLQMGLMGEVVHLPNCIDPINFDLAFSSQENSVVYVGRLSYEKGLDTLIDAFEHLEIKLKIIGTGPLREYLEKKVIEREMVNVEFLGYRTGQDLHGEIRKAMFLVIPSEWYENNPMTVIEAFALGKPVIGARIGGIPELVRDWETGFCFKSGDALDLRSKIKLMIKNKNKISEMGKNARSVVEQDFNSKVYYQNLMKIYNRAIIIAKSKTGDGGNHVSKNKNIHAGN